MSATAAATTSRSVPRGTDSPSSQRRRSSAVSPGTPQAIQIARNASLAFLQADVDGNKALDFVEFCSTVPKEADITREEMRTLFDYVDANGDGAISLDELFVWTLEYIEEETGMGVETFLRRFDTDGCGSLDAREFAKATEELALAPSPMSSFSSSTRTAVAPSATESSSTF